jgi:6-phosphogluconolactonase
LTVPSRPTPPAGVLHVVTDVAAAFAELVREELSRPTVGPSGRSVRTLVCSGGATARACYERLATTANVPWGRVELLLGDERCVEPTDEDANQRLVREALGERLQQVAAFWPMDCADPEGYAAIVESRQPLDIVHLGVGADGHTASLFPDSAALDSPGGSLVVRSTDPHGVNAHERMTLTFEAINRANLVVFTVAGTSKADAMRRLLAGDDLPAARVRASRVVWLCDAEALSASAAPGPGAQA